MKKLMFVVWLLVCPSFAQDPCPAQPITVWMRPEAAVDFLHGKLVFYRVGHGDVKGDWHLYNDGDKKYLSNLAAQIINGQMRDDKIEWATVEGKLPK